MIYFIEPLGTASGILNTVSFLKFINAPAGINKFLFTGKERMAFRADINLDNVYVLSGTGAESRAASALNGYQLVGRMNIFFHTITSQSLLPCYYIIFY